MFWNWYSSRRYLSTCRRGLPNLSQNFISRLAGASKHAEKVFPGSVLISLKKNKHFRMKTYMARGQPVKMPVLDTTIHVVQLGQRQCRPRLGYSVVSCQDHGGDKDFRLLGSGCS